MREFVIGRVRRAERWTLPPTALREAVINAVAHADYSQRGAPIRIALFDDRLEMENPGLLPFGLTIEDVRRGVSKLRNRPAYDRRLPRGRPAGAGEIGAHFRVTLSLIRRRKPLVDGTDQAILGLIRLSARAARWRLVALIGRGLVVEIGSGPQDPRRQYFLAER